MNKGSLVPCLFILLTCSILRATNPDGDLRIKMLEYYNLVVDHNIHSPTGASPRAVYIGVQYCNDGTNELTDVFTYIGNHDTGTPGIYPAVTKSTGPYTGTFSFTHEGGQKDAGRFIPAIAPGKCVTQYWLLSYPLLDANNNRVTGSKPDQTDDLLLRYDVWATARDNGVLLSANDSKTLHLRAIIAASANKIWPNTTSKVPSELKAAFPDKQLGWRQTTATTHPGASVVLEGIWFDLGNIGQGFDNDGDFLPDGNFLLQPVGNPALFDASCFRLVKVHGLIALKGAPQGIQVIEFEDQLHFANNPNTINGGVGMIFYEFAVLNGPCSSVLTPYQEVASGMNEKYNGDYGRPGGTLTSLSSNVILNRLAPDLAHKGDTIQFQLAINNTGSHAIGLPSVGSSLTFQEAIPPHTTYVSGSAETGNTLPDGVEAKVLYSVDGGDNWEENEPVPTSAITHIQWLLSAPLDPGATTAIAYDVKIDEDYPGPLLKTSGGIGLAGGGTFQEAISETVLDGNFSINQKIFKDDGTGGGILGDGIQNGSEAGIPNVTVQLFLDANENGIIDYSERKVKETSTSSDGAYQFDELSDGFYVIRVDDKDPDLPDKWTNTTPLEIPVDSLIAGVAGAHVGFAPLLVITNTLQGSSTVYESDQVNLNITASNRAYSEDADNSSTVTAWATIVDASNAYAVNPGNMLGPPDNQVATFTGNWDKKAVVKGFEFGLQNGTIKKVEVLFQLYVDNNVNNDKLKAYFQLENGSIQYFPDPVWSKHSSPNINDYVGPAKLGIITVDITNYQNWDWSVFGPEWKITLDGIIQGQGDGSKVNLDAVGIRITKSCCTDQTGEQGEPGNPNTIVQALPLVYEYDPEKLKYLSSSLVVDSIVDGRIYFDGLGPLYPAQSKTVNVQFKAISSTMSDCDLTAPECNTIPDPYIQCTPPGSGYFADVTINGNVNWNTILSNVNASDVKKKVRIKGTGTVTIPGGDLKLSTSAAMLVLDGVGLVVNAGNLKIESTSTLIAIRSSIQVYGNLEVLGNSLACFSESTLEVGDESANGLFNNTGSPTSAYFKNDGSKVYMYKVCLNVTANFEVSSAIGSESILVNVCGEIGDKGATHLSTGTLDGQDSGNIINAKTLKIYNSEIVVAQNIQNSSNSTFLACGSEFRTLNGNFHNSGQMKGCGLSIWVDDNHQIQQAGGSWTAALDYRRGNTSGSIPNLPYNSEIAAIAGAYNNCNCQSTLVTQSEATELSAKVTDAMTAGNATVNVAESTQSLEILRRGSLSGYIFGDKDGDGWIGVKGYETGTDYFLSGVKISLYGCKNSSGDLIYPPEKSNKSCTHGNNGGTWVLIAEDTTDAAGAYLFNGLSNGYYYAAVAENTIKVPVSQTADPDKTSGICNPCDSKWKNPDANMADLGIIGIGNNQVEINFGYSLDEAILGKVWKDADGDGIQENGEGPLSGVTLTRVHSGCTEGVNCPTTVTNAEGEYVFYGLTPGTSYTIKVVTSSLPVGGTWTSTAESDGTPNNAITKSVGANVQSYGNNFGLFQTGNSGVTGTVYFDWHGNAFLNSSDEGIPFVKLSLYEDENADGNINEDDAFIKTIETAPSGNFTFPNIPAGNYTIVVLENTLPIFPDQTKDPDEIGICTVCDGMAKVTGVNGTSSVGGFEFGYEVNGTGTIQGMVYTDMNLNGIFNRGEAILSGIEVGLEANLNGDTAFVLIRTDVSQSDGIFSFRDLPDGFYRITVNPLDEDLPLDAYGERAILTGSSFATTTLFDGQMIEVDGSACTNCSAESLSFGFAYAGNVESYVFYDSNGNGVKDWNETGIPGITLYICPAADGTCNATNAIDTVMTTGGANADSIGLFRFGGIAPGSYTIAIDTLTLPAGLRLSADPGTDGQPCTFPLDPADPDYAFLLTECDQQLKGFTVGLNTLYAGANFGYRPCGVIGDLVWNDINGDGLKNEEEQGIAGVVVNITNVTSVAMNGLPYDPYTYTDSRATDFDGLYTFENLSLGTWQVELTPPAGVIPTYDADGGSNFTTIVEVTGCDLTEAGNSWCPPGEDCSLNVTFGMRPDQPNSVSGTVCFDLDEDGKCDTGGEVFPQGIIVNLRSNDGSFSSQQVTDTLGNFTFPYLPNDTFSISVSTANPPFQLTSFTTSIGDTPAFQIGQTSWSVFQKVVTNGDITGVYFGFTFSQAFDLGDLPPPYVTNPQGNPPGPVHFLDEIPGLYLGSSVDAESFPDLQPEANGDDLAGDDEDGVTFLNLSNWTAGPNGGSIMVDVTGDGWLVAWGDFNQDGDFADTGEIVVNQLVTTGNYNFSINIPAGTAFTGGQDYFFRFRLFEQAPFSPALAYNGVTNGGEVEDYLVYICKNLSNAGVITGAETGCNGFNPTPITEQNAPSGGGGTIEYQWQQSEDNGTTWTDIPNAISQTFDPDSIFQTTLYRRGARRSSCASFVYSDPMSKTVFTNFDDPGIIVGNEENCGIYDPGVISSAMEPDGGDGEGTPGYKWQQSTDNGATWSDILNASSETYNPGAISQTTWYRRGARKTPCSGFIWSNALVKMVTVNYTNAGTITGDEIVCGSYDPAAITSQSLPSGGVDGYETMQWEKSVDNGVTWTDIPGANAAVYDPGVISQTTQFRRKARRLPCLVWVNSNVVTKTVKNFPLAVIDNYPSSGTGNLCELEGYMFGAADAGANVSYSWDFGSYATPANAAGTGPYEVRFDVPETTEFTNTTVRLTTTKNGCVAQDSVALIFRPEIIFTGIGKNDPTACQASDGSLTINANYPAGASLEYSVDGGVSWSSNNTITGLPAGIYNIKARYTGADCPEMYGNISLSDPPPQADILVSSNEECTGQVVTVEAVPQSGTPSFGWTFGNGAVPNTITGAGPHDITFPNGGPAVISLTITEGNCSGFRDTTIAIVSNFTNGGAITGAQVLCGTNDPALLDSGSSPSGGTGGGVLYQWEYRESNGAGGWGAWNVAVGANASSYDPSPISVTSEYRRKARRTPCGNWVTSNTVLVRLIARPNLTDDNYNTACPGFAYTDYTGNNDLNLVNPVFSVLAVPNNGSLDFDSDGEFIYSPNSTFCGSDIFTYQVCNDGTTCCDTATVTIDLSDTEIPLLTNVPDNLVINCDDELPLPAPVEVWENCQTVSMGLNEISTKGLDSCLLHNYQVVRVWTAVDYCTNGATSQQTITVEDQTAPDIFRVYTLPNGKKMVAGVMENVNNLWKTVKLPIQFATKPVVLSQVVTNNGSSAVIARMRNISTTQFQLKLQEQELNSGVRPSESVAWIAFEKGAIAGSTPFEVGTWSMTSIVTNRSFAQTYPGVPEFVANIQTYNEADPVTIRFTNRTNTGMDIWTAEETSKDVETSHGIETVGFFAYKAPGSFKNQSGEVIGEIGQVVLTHNQTTVNLQNTYHNPVVVFGGLTNSDAAPVTVKVISVSSNSFQVRLKEWDYLDGVHGSETLSYMVVEGSLPLNKIVECNAIPAPLAIGSQLIALDNCDQFVTLEMAQSTLSFNCQTDTVFTRTYTVTDDCGNSTSLTQTFFLRDTSPPAFTAPPNTAILCGQNKDNLSLTGDVTNESDNCATGINATYSDDMTNMVNCSGYVTRTWTLTDYCGNSTSKMQVIHIASLADADQDGIVDYFDLDDDNDGIPDAFEVNPVTGTDIDTDGDGIPNRLDRDSDNDGIPDLIEIGGKDTDGDGRVDNQGLAGWDNDGDGFALGFDGTDYDTSFVASVVFNPLSLVNDRDGDGVPNYLDLDSDNDGIPDLIEVGGLDTDGDGVIDYPVANNPGSMADADNDGFNDYYDSDDDGTLGAEDASHPLIKFDGAAYFGGLVSDRPDFDGDGIPNFLDSDSDNDGIPDLIEQGGIDTDGDGKIELTGEFEDADGKGFHDNYTTYPLVTTDTDGFPIDGRPKDDNNDGTAYKTGDADKDGLPNFLDLDSDGDDIKDILEAGNKSRDNNSDGVLDDWSDINLNGFDDLVENATIFLTESDGAINDGRPEDGGDADSSPYLSTLADGIFASSNGMPDIDDDGDGILNFMDTDSDNDFLPDKMEDKNRNLVQDVNETGLFNPDSDGDGILDGIEDANRNGKFETGETDPLNSNTDGDFLDDGEEDDNKDGIVDEGESDPRDPCQPYLSNNCKGLILDLKVKLLGALIDNDTIPIMSDQLRFYNYLPVLEPYSRLSTFRHIGENGDQTGPAETLPKEILNTGQFYITGNDAPVDWILVELRRADNPSLVIATRAALIQRDGDIREIDGLNYVRFKNLEAGSYYVSLKHRNHLGVMTENPYVLSPAVTRIDFSNPETPIYGENAMALHNGERALWPGDFNGDGKVVFQGPSNDILHLFKHVILDTYNTNELANYVMGGYSQTDANMDGTIIYQGPNNDRIKVLIHAILGTPENTFQLSNYILWQKMP